MTFDSAYFAPSITGAWRVDLLHQNTREMVASLTAVDGAGESGLTGGGLDWSIFTTIRDTGDLEAVMPAREALVIDWASVLARVRWEMTAPSQIMHTLGTYRVSSAKVTITLTPH